MMSSMNWPIVAGAALLPVAAAGTIAFGCSVPSSQMLGPSLVRGRVGKRRVALTFDDGPADPYTNEILDVLRQADARATFFVCGKNVERLPDVSRRICAEGHALGNHTFSHPFLYFKSKEFIAAEIDRTQTAIERFTGVQPRLFRPPYGARWFGLFAELRERGMQCIQWSNPSFDWLERATPEKIARHVLHPLQDGDVILMHDGREPRLPEEVDASVTVRALSAIIEGVEKAGFEFVTIPEFLD
jgi:peptidoglycan-N-acetylglucosamine deacetylase